jgi:broad specificity phosphatase PhoE
MSTSDGVSGGDATTRAVVYLVRHGRTELNAAGLLRGRLDPPLDDMGEREAAALGQQFARVTIAAIVSSPLERGRQTAEAITTAVNRPGSVGGSGYWIPTISGSVCWAA